MLVVLLNYSSNCLKEESGRKKSCNPFIYPTIIRLNIINGFYAIQQLTLHTLLILASLLHRLCMINPHLQHLEIA